MIGVEYVPTTVLERALDSFKGLGKDTSKFRVSVRDDDQNWLVHFIPLNPNRRGGDVKIWIAKETLEVTDVRRYQ